MPKALRVDFTGPFFTGNPHKTFRANIRDFMDELASEGARDVRLQIEAKRGAMKQSTGFTAQHVRGRTSSLGGKRWQVSAVVSMDTRGMTRAQAIRTQAAASSIEGRFHPFRRTTARMKRARPAQMARLLKGIA